MELQTENGKKKAPLSTGLKWLRLVCMAVVFGIIAGGVMVGMNYLGGSMAAEEESIPQTSTVKVTAKAEDSDAVVAVARGHALGGDHLHHVRGGDAQLLRGTQDPVQGAGTGVIGTRMSRSCSSPPTTMWWRAPPSSRWALWTKARWRPRSRAPTWTTTWPWWRCSFLTSPPRH